MPLLFRALHAPSKPELLNEEWMLLENTGPGLVNAAGCALTIGREGHRPHPIGTLSPGFVLKPGEKIKVVTGSPSKKSQGTPPPPDGEKNYYLFLREPILK